MTTDIYTGTLKYPLSADAAQRSRRTLSEQIIEAFMTLLQLGTGTIKDQRQVKYIKICNFITMTSVIASLLYIVLSLIWANLLWFIAVNSLCICSITVLWLNRSGRTDVSRNLYLISVNTLLFLTSLIVGPQAHTENFLLIAVLVPFLIYDIDDIRRIIFGVSMPVVFILSYSYLEPLFAHYHLSTAQQLILRTINVPMEVGVTIAAVYQFVFYSRVTEQKLEASNQLMTAQTIELRRSNTDLEQFAYVISHDLKAPVRMISCFMNLLIQKDDIQLDTEAREFVDYARQSAKRMDQLIDDVLAYSRIGRNLTAPTSVDLNDVIYTIRYEIESKANAADTGIIIDRPLPVISQVHSSLMYHIFLNLIRNGLKFNNSSTPRVHIGCSESAESYTLSVRDNGIGIERRYADQIFQMFIRLHTDAEYEGTGIGLAICKKIVEHYHGEIWFESLPGSGTTFFFTIRKH